MHPCKNAKMNHHCNLTRYLALFLAVFLPSVILASNNSVLPEGTRIALQLNTNLSTKQNREGDTFTAVVTTPVILGGQIVIPRGSTVSGSISRVIRPGRFKGKAVMNLLFHSVDIPGRGRFAIAASLADMDSRASANINDEGTIEGKSSHDSDVGKVLTPGLVGAGIGALAGGGKGAGVGAGAGSAVGLATVFATRGRDLEIPRGSTMDISLDRPLTVPLENAGKTGGSR